MSLFILSVWKPDIHHNLGVCRWTECKYKYHRMHRDFVLLTAVHLPFSVCSYTRPTFYIIQSIIISAPLGYVNKDNSLFPITLVFFFSCFPLGVVLGYERKICCNKGQVCHFLTVSHILLHKCSSNQEMLLMSLANIQTPLDGWQLGVMRKL